MGEAEENPNWFDNLGPDLAVEIFLRLPPESILKSRTVSKQWRSILESKLFVERRKNIGKSRRKILAAYHCTCSRRPRLLPESRFEGDEEIVYLHCHPSRPSLSCDGLLCFPEPLWITVSNPSTRQLRRFPSGLNTNYNLVFTCGKSRKFCWTDWSVGFGRDKVTGSYKVVKMKFNPNGFGGMLQCGVLDVETGEWQKLSPPPFHVISVTFQSACVNGSIYWFYYGLRGYSLLALDLHEEDFHDVPSFPSKCITRGTAEIVNLEDRLAIANTKQVGPQRILEILSMDADEETWTKTYSIDVTHLDLDLDLDPNWVVFPSEKLFLFKPLALSKQGNLVFSDNHKRLFKYYPGSDYEVVRCISTDIPVMSLYLENLVPLPLKNSSHTYPDPDTLCDSTSKCTLHAASWISSIFSQIMDAPPSADIRFISISMLLLLFIWLVEVGLNWRHSR